METVNVNNHSDAFEKWAQYAQKNGSPTPLTISVEAQKWIVEFCKKEEQHKLIIIKHKDKTGMCFIADAEILNDCFAYFTSHSFISSKEKPNNNAFSVFVSRLN